MLPSSSWMNMHVKCWDMLPSSSWLNMHVKCTDQAVNHSEFHCFFAWHILRACGVFGRQVGLLQDPMGESQGKAFKPYTLHLPWKGVEPFSLVLVCSEEWNKKPSTIWTLKQRNFSPHNWTYCTKRISNLHRHIPSLVPPGRWRVMDACNYAFLAKRCLTRRDEGKHTLCRRHTQSIIDFALKGSQPLILTCCGVSDPSLLSRVTTHIKAYSHLAQKLHVWV